MMVHHIKYTGELEQATEGSVGFDLIGTEFKQHGNKIVYHTGVKLELPNNVWALLACRSNIAKKNWFLSNNVGIIDSDFRGEILVMFQTTDSPNELTNPIPPYTIGQKIAQLIFLPKLTVNLIPVETIEVNTTRGEGGFGSTDKIK